mmetsp:Transcript_7266/g.16090  ORF Transcript_7266/g.16090 Transcript_7266/m.16090 type:complete len:215 (-) Transcript_7266:408-1052(-)
MATEALAAVARASRLRGLAERLLQAPLALRLARRAREHRRLRRARLRPHVRRGPPQRAAHDGRLMEHVRKFAVGHVRRQRQAARTGGGARRPHLRQRAQGRRATQARVAQPDGARVLAGRCFLRRGGASEHGVQQPRRAVGAKRGRRLQLRARPRRLRPPRHDAHRVGRLLKQPRGITSETEALTLDGVYSSVAVALTPPRDLRFQHGQRTLPD